MVNKLILKKVGKVFAIYGVQIWVILFVANIGLITFIRFKANAQSCMTQEQIGADSRCLYILAGEIYTQGSRSSPHKGNPCGTDVTSIIPSFHTSNINQYLLPNYVGSLCTSNPTAVPTAIPTPTPTEAPTIAPTPTNSPSPTAAPTDGIVNQNNSVNPTPTRSPTPLPTQNPSSTPSPTNNSSELTTKTPSPTPSASTVVENSSTPDIGRFGSKSAGPIAKVAEDTPQIPEQKPPTVSQTQYNLIYWTTVFSYISFGLLLLIGVFWAIQQIKIMKMAKIDVKT